MSPVLLAPLCPVMTVAIYAISKRLYGYKKSLLTTPSVLTPILLVGVVALCGIPYDVYIRDSRLLTWLLGPATVAFAIPIYEHRELIARHPLALASGALTGIALGLVSSWGLAQFFNLPPELVHSLLPRSVSTPFALTTIDSFHGASDLTALFVLITGIFGMVAGEVILTLLPLRSRIARGALFGAAAHAGGTAKAMEVGQKEGVASSLTMILAGIGLVLISPLLAHLL